METIECIKTRQSIRRFTEQEVSDEVVTEIVDAARMAPSWKNTQTIRYVVVRDKEVLKKIADNYLLGFEGNIKTVSQCSAMVVLVQVNGRCGYERDGSFTTSKGAAWEMFDAGIAAQTFCLAAHDKGVGSVILGIFDDAGVAEAIGLEDGKTVAALIPIGYPKFIPDKVPRKEVIELLSFK